MIRHWYEDEVRDLVNYSEQVFETIIPCAEEIQKLDRFIWEMTILYNKGKKARFIVPEKRSFLFRVSNIREIDVPEDAVWLVVSQAKQILDNKCKYLAELCGYKRKEEKK